MKHKFSLLLFIMFILVGCQESTENKEISYPQSITDVFMQEEKISEIDTNSTLNQAVDLFQLQMNQKQLAAIIHEPSVEQLNRLNDLEVVEYYQNPNDERFLIVSKNIGSKIRIYEVMYKDDELIETKILLESQFIKDKQVFDLKCIVPEGIPQMKIVIEYKENEVEYLVTYDGIGIRPQIEYLEYKD